MKAVCAWTFNKAIILCIHLVQKNCICQTSRVIDRFVITLIIPARQIRAMHDGLLDKPWSCCPLWLRL